MVLAQLPQLLVVQLFSSNVTVKGHLVGRCVIFFWRRTVTAAPLASRSTPGRANSAMEEKYTKERKTSGELG